MKTLPKKLSTAGLTAATLTLATLALAACGSADEAGPGPGSAAPGPGAAPTAEPGPATPPPACPAGEPFRLVANKIVLDVSIDGGPRQKWFLDTGAPETVADKSIADQVMGKGSVKLTAGGVTKELAPGVMDVRTASRMDVVGVLGQDFFGEVLTLDYPRSRLWIEPELNEPALAACDHVAGKASTVDATYEDFLYVRGTAEGRPGWFLVDTGASMGALTKGVFAELDAKHPRPSLTGYYTPAAIGKFWARLTTVGYLEVGTHKVEHVLTRTTDDKLLPSPKVATAGEPLLGVLPSGFMRHFMVTTDFKKHKLRIDPKKGDSLREPTSVYPLGIGLAENLSGPAIVSAVLPGSAAAAAGIVPGDEIVSADGAALAPMDPFERPFRLVGDKAGQTVDVEVKHEGAVTSHELVAKVLLTPPALP